MKHIPKVSRSLSSESSPATRRGIAQAIKALGSQSALARALDVSQPTVYGWASGRRGVCAATAIRIEEATEKAGSLVSRSAIRPDIFGRG